MAPNSKAKLNDALLKISKATMVPVPNVVVQVPQPPSPREQLVLLENERNIQRQKLEELARQKLEIDNEMTKLCRSLEKLDQDIESIEFGLLKSRTTSGSNATTSCAAVVKTEAVATVKAEMTTPDTSTSSTLIAVNAEPKHVTSSNKENVEAVDGSRLPLQPQHIPSHRMGDVGETRQSITTTVNPYSIHTYHTNRMTMATQHDDQEILTDPNVVATMTMEGPSCNNEYWTEPNDEADDFRLDDNYDDDDDDVEEFEPDDHDKNAFVRAYVQQQQEDDELEEVHQKKPAFLSVAATNLPKSNQNNNRHETQHVVTPPNETAPTYPWTSKIFNLLQNTFRIPSFREQQLEIINTTMQGLDVFVIMRTGGGKSLTYQLPALYEGRYGPNGTNKITLVISPLLSLIQDQEEQMNMFAPGSAVSFTSSIVAAEHTRRWKQVQDSKSGVCIMFCTPEKVSKSNRLCAELDKLHAQNRLGRFVIDEAHCACQWGHDFRPDYAKLGKLKSHFPSIPIIAVTATASDRVRDDVCEILRIRRNYRFFRSTFCRPNLIYSVVPKPDNKDSIIELMATFIKTKYPHDAGIVYTLSRKDADTVADALCNLGVVAEPYHSDVNASTKEAVHKSWMRNETQVVVATIAFGLGINKPDVRFVLHHSISKTLETYYQESGRAGRDGNPSECVLLYNPKDVFRMLKMVHGSSSEHLVWPMVRYAQQSGNDAICKAILLTHLGEPNTPDVMQVVSENQGIVTHLRDVGKHAKTVVELLHLRVQQDANVTMAMLVKDWRNTGAGAEQCVKDNPPKKDGLTQEDCERIITSLILEKAISTNPKWNAYDTVIYLVLGEFGRNFLLPSSNPKFVMTLPLREDTSKAATAGVQPTKAAKQSTIRQTITKNGEWLSTKPAPVKRKKATAAKPKPIKKMKVKATKKIASKAATKVAVKAKPAKERPPRDSNEVIELSSDDDTEPDVPLVSLRQSDEPDADDIWNDNDGSDDEYEFEE